MCRVYFGHFTVSKVWKRKDETTYELNIAAEVLHYPIEETLDTMLHEMVHLYCKENGIQDVSRGGKYHNKRFKAEAERVGLECYETEKYGWNTKPSDRMIQYALDNDWTEIMLGRETHGTLRMPTGSQTATPVPVGGGKRPSSTRKYICPVCGQSIRATKDVNIICGDCMIPMVKA